MIDHPAISVCLLFTLHAILLPQSGHCQDAGPADRAAQEIQMRQEQRERERERELLERQQLAPAGSAAIPETQPSTVDGECLEIDSLDIQGMTLFPKDRFSAEIANVVGPCRSGADLNMLLRAITNAYVARGYVTSRALLGPQALREGRLLVTVVEADLEAIEPTEDGPSRGSVAMAMPGLSGRILNLRGLEQGIDQLNRLPSNNATIDIAPGVSAGASRVLVRGPRDDQPLRVSIDIDNAGQDSTGRAQSTITLEADDSVGLGDFVSLSYMRSLGAGRDRGSESYSVFASLPYGYTTFSFSGGYYRYDSVIETSAQRFPNSGSSWNLFIGADQLLLRDANSKFAVSASLRLTDTFNSIRGIRLRSSSYRLVTLAIDGRLQQRIGNGLLTVSLGARRGVGALGASAADAGPGGPEKIFTKFTSALGYQRSFKLVGQPLYYAGQLAGQLTDRAVLPAERLGLGGSGTVRGFRKSGISGDNGFFSRQQFGSDLKQFSQKGLFPPGRLSAFASYDAGLIIADSRDAFERGFIHSLATGFQLTLGHLDIEIIAAIPISAPSFVPAAGTELAASARLRL